MRQLALALTMFRLLDIVVYGTFGKLVFLKNIYIGRGFLLLLPTCMLDVCLPASVIPPILVFL